MARTGLFASVAALDELAAGVGPLTTPEVQATFGLTAGVAAAVMLGLTGLLSVFVEPWLVLRLGRRPLRAVVAAALAAIGAAAALCAWAPHPMLLAVALVAFGPASGVGCAFAQAALVTTSGPERATARWALSGALGDLAAPLVFVLGVGWRPAYAGVAVAALALAATIAMCGQGAVGRPDADAAGAPRLRLRDALGHRSLLLAAAAGAACTLLDEIVLGFGALYLQTKFGLEAGERGLALGAWTAAGLAGVFVLDRWGARSPGRVRMATKLLIAGAVCGALFGASLLTSSVVAATVLFAGAGFFAAWHYPLCLALAYTAARDRALLVPATCALFLPVDLVAPFCLAWLANGAGVTAAMAVLLAQPVVVMGAALALRRRLPGA